MASNPEITEAENELTLTDEATGLSMSVPVASNMSILSPAGIAALRIAEAFLEVKIAEAASPKNRFPRLEK